MNSYNRVLREDTVRLHNAIMRLHVEYSFRAIVFNGLDWISLMMLAERSG